MESNQFDPLCCSASFGRNLFYIDLVARHVFHLPILVAGGNFSSSISRYLLHSAKAFMTELNGALPITSKVTCTEFGLQEWIFRRKAPVPKGAMQMERTQKKEHYHDRTTHKQNAITSLSYENRIKYIVIVNPCKLCILRMSVVESSESTWKARYQSLKVLWGSSKSCWASVQNENTRYVQVNACFG